MFSVRSGRRPTSNDDLEGGKVNIDEASIRYDVVMNEEQQYSIWPADRPIPTGWQRDGFTGTKQECLDHIDQLWTDMRPRSLREAMSENESTRS